jgi:hypothetical protein
MLTIWSGQSMDGLAALHFEEIGRQLSLVSKKEARFSETPDRRLGAAACEAFHAVWLWLSVTIAASVQPARLLIVPDIGGEQYEKGVALRTKPIPRTLRMRKGPFGPSILRRSRPI